MTAPRAWLDKQGGYVYLRVDGQWYENEIEYNVWEAAYTTCAWMRKNAYDAWMRKNAYELHPREAARLEKDRKRRKQ